MKVPDPPPPRKPDGPDDWAERIGRPTPARRRQRPGVPLVPYYAQLAAVLDTMPSRVVPALHRALLLALASFCNPDGSECFPSVARLATRMGLTRRRVVTMLLELETAMWIVRTPRMRPGRGGQTSTLYRVRLGGGPIAQLPRTRPGRVTAFIRPVSKAERDAAGVLDLTAKRAQRAAHAQTAPDK